MKKGILILFCFNLSFAFFSVSGQSEVIYLSSDSIIKKGIEYHNNDEYDKAISCYKQVSKSDPGYEWACYEMALSHYYMDNNEEAMAKCKEALFLNYDEPVVYSLMSTLLDEMGKPAEGITLLTDVIKRWPYNQNLLYNLAVSYISIGQPEQAEKILLQSVLLNPYHLRTHLGLAKVNYMMGRMAQSYLAYNMVLLINPTINNISSYEEAIFKKMKVKSQRYKYPYQQYTDSLKWDELKDLLESELAFNENFDYNFDVNYSINRQSLILFQKIKFDPSDTSVYNQFYVRLFSEMYQKIGYESYLNYVLQNTNNEKVAAWLKKNPDKLKEFINWAQSYINKGRVYGFSYQNEKELKETFHYDDDGSLVSIGPLNAKSGKIKYGNWIIIGNKGSISEKGKYINNKAEGEWLVYWPDGNLKKRLNFINDNLEGSIYTYYPNGVVNEKISYKSGKYDGVFERYSSSGILTLKLNYSNGMANGNGIYYAFTEGFKREFSYSNDTVVGENKETWLNDNPKNICNYKKGMAEGTYKSWYPNAKRESEMTYLNDTICGKYYRYYSNDSLNVEREYNRGGHLTGEIITYDRNGKITDKEGDYTDGTLSGYHTEYFPDGKKQRISTYKNDSLLQYESFDDKGNVCFAAKKTDGSIYMKYFYTDGIINSEGILKNNQFTGKWKYYNPLGILTGLSNYSNDLLNGPKLTFYENGKVKEVYNYSNNLILGEYKEYYIEGNLKSWGNYDSTGRAGKWINYFANDSISDIGFYKDNKLVGRFIRFFPNGNKVSEDFFDEEGNFIRQIIYDPDGKIAADMDFKFGKHTFEILFPDGKLKERISICDNLYHGIHEKYYPNGQIAYQTEYDHRYINGFIKYWDYQGNLTYEMPYLMNLPEGDGKWYEDSKLDYFIHYESGEEQGKSFDYFNGKMIREMEYQDGVRNGITDYYAPDGIFMYRVRFVNGTMKAFSYKDNTGNLIPEIAISDTTKKIITYYSNGKVSASIEISKGLYHGIFKTYYYTGTMLREAMFKFDQYSDYDRNYYPNNKLREATNYYCDEKNGQYELYYENGVKRKEGKYYMNMADGEWKVYGADGKLKEILTYRNGDIYDIKAK